MPLIVLLIALATISLSVGFSSFSTELQIGDMALTVGKTPIIKLMSATQKEVSAGTTIQNLEYLNTTATLDINLPNQDSYAIIETEITNIGEVEMGISSITSGNPNLKYEIVNSNYSGYQNYNYKETLCDDRNTSTCKLGTATKVLVKISYASQDVYNSVNTNFSLNLNYNFKQMLKITYGKTFEAILISPKIYYVMKGENLEIGVNYSDVSNVMISSGATTLTPNTDYTLQNKKLTVNNVQDDLTIGLKSATSNGLTIDTEWLDDNSVEVMLNGTLTSDLYIRVRKGDTYIATSASDLYNSTYASNPLYTATTSKPKTVFIQYDYVEGSCNLAGAFTVKYRDATSSCNQVRTAQLIANFSTANFTMDQTFRNTEKLTVNVSGISIFATKGSNFNDMKFIISYGEQ